MKDLFYSGVRSKVLFNAVSRKMNLNFFIFIRVRERNASKIMTCNCNFKISSLAAHGN